MRAERTRRDLFLDGVGVASDDLREGVRVIVPVGAGTGSSSIAALAVCVGPDDAEGWWWFELFMVPGGSPLPQRYRVEDLLGLAANGLTMPGLDPATAVQPG